MVIYETNGEAFRNQILSLIMVNHDKYGKAFRSANIKFNYDGVHTIGSKY